MRTETVLKVKKAINLALADCEETGNYPTLCRLKSDANGLAKIHEVVINLIVNENLDIDEALGQMESSWT